MASRLNGSLVVPIYLVRDKYLAQYSCFEPPQNDTGTGSSIPLFEQDYS